MTSVPRRSALLGLLAIGAGPVRARTGRLPVLRRGIGLGHTFAWAEIGPGEERPFAFPPFSDPARTLASAQLRALRAAGLDFVRLAVDPGPFLQFGDRRRAWSERVLDDAVRTILGHDLSVIVDFHPSDLHPDYVPTALTGGVRTPRFQAYLRLLAATATRLAALGSDRVLLELMNEPEVAPALWQPLLEAAYAAARAGAPRLPLVLGGGLQNSAEALLALDTRPFARDPAVIYTFHDYTPYQYTHQGAAGNDAFYLADVPYPATVRPLSESFAATRARISASDLDPAARKVALASARRQLATYGRSGVGRDALAAGLERIAVWARDRDIAPGRILLGEFGARLPADPSAVRSAERATWFRDMRLAAEARGFAWAAWVYRGAGGFALATDETGPGLDPVVADALGLSGVDRGR